MIGTIFSADTQNKVPPNREGDLYKEFTLHGHTFSLYYGYYEERERENPAAEPMPIYPDFLKEPRYTADGFPFVTKMQDACKHYKGRRGKFSECAECEYYLHGDELLGLCVCPENKNSAS